MPGGTAAIRQPWRMAASYLDIAYDRATPERLTVVRRNAPHWGDVVSLARAGVSSPLTSSADGLVISGGDLVRATAEELLADVDPAVIAARFHNGVVDVIVRACGALRERPGIATVARA